MLVSNGFYSNVNCSNFLFDTVLVMISVPLYWWQLGWDTIFWSCYANRSWRLHHILLLFFQHQKPQLCCSFRMLQRLVWHILCIRYQVGMKLAEYGVSSDLRCFGCLMNIQRTEISMVRTAPIWNSDLEHVWCGQLCREAAKTIDFQRPSWMLVMLARQLDWTRRYCLWPAAKPITVAGSEI